MGKVVSPVEAGVQESESDIDALSNPMEEAIFSDPISPLIVLIPLDGRPSSWLYPLRLADIAGVRLAVPPLEYLGWRDKHGDPQALMDWLDSMPKQVEGVLVSLDALLYGGLVQSRSSTAPIKTPGEIAGFLARFLRERPGCRLHCMKSIPRIGTTVLRTSDLVLHEELWKKGTSTLSDQDLPEVQEALDDKDAASEDSGDGSKKEDAPEVPPSDKDEAKPKDIKTEITQEMLEAAWQEHLAAREMNKSNHLELLSELLPMSTSWCIAIEDGDPAGPQNGEAEELLENVPENARKKVTALCGCDEQGMVMLARHLRDRIEGRLPLGLWWSFPESINLTAKYECIDVGKNLARFMDHLRISPIEAELSSWSTEPSVILGSTPKEITSRKTPLLIINNFESEQLDHIVDGRPSPLPEEGGDCPISFLSPLLLADLADIHVADIAWANGGDPMLDSVLALGNGNYLQGYSSWNTAGNTFGKALAQIVCRAYRGLFGIRGKAATLAAWAAERFKFESLLTDRWFPQIVRRRLWNLVTENGGDPWNFNLYTIDLVEKGCKELAKPVRSSYESRHRAIYRGRSFVVPQTIDAEITFPWNRLFEIDLRVYAEDVFIDEFSSGKTE